MTMIDPKTIWKWPPSEYALRKHAAATPALIDETERRLGVTLPGALREIYLVQNGGRTRFVNHDIPDNDFLCLQNFVTLREEGEGIDFGEPEENWNTVLKDTDKLLVIARHGTDAFLCLDFRPSAGGDPEVALFDTVGAVREMARYPTFEKLLQTLLNAV